MKKYTRLQVILAALMGISLLVPAFAFAQTAAVTTSAAANVTTPVAGASASVTLSATVMTRAKTKADTEIDRRTAALSDLLTRVSAMTKVSDTFKQTLSTNIQSQTTALATLKTKIDADTDGATLKADVQSVTTAYRVFALVIPQGRIAAAADREATIINMFIGVGNKIQARLQASGAAGSNITSLTATLTDMGTQLTSAQTHAQAAISGSASLTPDGGDATLMASNAAALKQANTDIKAAQTALQAARKDLATLITGLKALPAPSSSASASSTVQSQ